MIEIKIRLVAITVIVGTVVGFLAHELYGLAYLSIVAPPPRVGQFSYEFRGRIEFASVCVYALGLGFVAYPVLGRAAMFVAFALALTGCGLIGVVFSDPLDLSRNDLIPALVGGFFAGLLIAGCVFAYSISVPRPSQRVQFSLRMLFVAMLAVSVLFAGMAIRRQQFLQEMNRVHLGGDPPRSADW